MTDAGFTLILEDIKDQNRAVLEAIGQMRVYVARIPAIEADIRELKDDVKTIKHILTDTNKDVVDHERRITRLETKVL